ncbi:MAG: hypothetical protein LUI02_02210 [Clostridiales bacterium]|nr:hypothetical protein [Clostridiales bacterium]
MEKTTTVTFRYGALSPGIEEQAKEQGFTLGEDAELFQRVADVRAMLFVRGYMTDAQERSITQKISDDIARHLVPLKGVTEE